jgi:hypothetical protein
LCLRDHRQPCRHLSPARSLRHCPRTSRAALRLGLLNSRQGDPRGSPRDSPRGSLLHSLHCAQHSLRGSPQHGHRSLLGCCLGNRRFSLQGDPRASLQRSRRLVPRANQRNSPPGSLLGSHLDSPLVSLHTSPRLIRPGTPRDNLRRSPPGSLSRAPPPIPLASHQVAPPTSPQCSLVLLATF